MKFLGNLSTNPAKDQPAFADKAIAHSFYTIVLTSAAAGMPFPVGTPFKGSKYTVLKDGISSLKARSEYVIMAIPNCFPIGWGVSGVPVGPPTDEIDCFFAAAHSSGPAWFDLVTSHETLVGQLILDNLVALVDVLPTLAPTTTIAPDPFHSWTGLSTVEQEATFVTQCATHSARLAAFANPPFLIGGVASAQLDSIPEDDVSALSTPAKKKGDIFAVDQCLATHRLYLGRFYDDGDGLGEVFHPGALNEEAEECFADKNVTFGAQSILGLISAQQTLNQYSRDFHVRNCKLTAFDNSSAAQGLLFNLKGTDKPQTNSFATLKGTKKGLTTLLFAPDTPSMELKRQENSEEDVRQLEMLSGENKANLTKINTDMLVVSQVTTSLGQILRLLSNNTLHGSALCQFESTLNEKNAPLLHSMSFQFSAALSDQAFLEWFSVLGEKHKAAFLYWILERVEQVLQSALSFANNRNNISALLKQNYAGIKKAPHDAIADSITNSLSTISNFLISGATEVPVGYLYRSTDHFARMTRKAANTAAAPAPVDHGRKHPSTYSESGRPFKSPRLESGSSARRPAPSRGRAEGEIIYVGQSRTPIPSVSGATRLCLMHIRNGTQGCNQASCPYDHPLKYADWHPALQAGWKDLVSTDPNFSWNGALVNFS